MAWTMASCMGRMQACQRHWTAGGALRRVETGAGKRNSRRARTAAGDGGGSTAQRAAFASRGMPTSTPDGHLIAGSDEKSRSAGSDAHGDNDAAGDVLVTSTQFDESCARVAGARESAEWSRAAPPFAQKDTCEVPRSAAQTLHRGEPAPKMWHAGGGKAAHWPDWVRLFLPNTCALACGALATLVLDLIRCSSAIDVWCSSDRRLCIFVHALSHKRHLVRPYPYRAHFCMQPGVEDRNHGLDSILSGEASKRTWRDSVLTGLRPPSAPDYQGWAQQQDGIRQASARTSFRCYICSVAATSQSP